MIIYKYLNEEGAIKTIKKNSVLLRTPLEYNDPFDSVFYVNETEMNKAYELFMNFELFKKVYNDFIINSKKLNWLGKIAAKEVKNYAPFVKRDKVYKKQECLQITYKLGLKILNKNDRTFRYEFKKHMNDVMESLRGIALISCFGLDYNSILMWSHYSDHHRGACIEFEVDDKDFRKVEYNNKLLNFKFCDALEILFGHEFAGVEVDTTKPEFQFILGPISTKSNDWSYEREVRCIYSKTKLDPKIHEDVDDDGKKIYLLDMPKIKKIYLGCKATKEFISDIKRSAGNIPVIKLKRSEDQYSLIEDLTNL